MILVLVIWVACSGTPDGGTEPAKIDKAKANAAYQQGIALAHATKLKEARDALERCVAIDPNHLLCHKALGGVYAKLNDPDRGLAHYKKFLELQKADEAQHVSPIGDYPDPEGP